MSADNAELNSLRREISELSTKVSRQEEERMRLHTENKESQEADREAFRQAMVTQQQTFMNAMQEQRNLFQDAINKQFVMHVDLEKQVAKSANLLEGVIGNGQPGSGRIGVLEESMEIMKKFRWQALTAMAFSMWLAELWVHRGH